MNYLNLIRYKNLLLLAFMQLLFRYGFLKLQDIPLALTDFQFGLLVFSTLLIAAGGYVINDIFDQDTDAINKPKKVIIRKYISEAKAYNLYVLLTLSGVFIGYYLSNVILRPGFLSIFIFIAAVLYFYATTLKKIMIIGNITVAFLLAFSVLIIGVFDIFPATYDENRKIMTDVFSVLKDYAVFAFSINFIREIVKDLEDIDGDYNQGMRTLPIIVGKNRTQKALSTFMIIPIFILLIYINNRLMINGLYLSTIYVLIFIVAPLIVCCINLWNSDNKKRFSTISIILKLIIFFGILSIIIIDQNIKHNA
ncbi:MAG: geranylgeranylglycerol-phosphate geranylgeranyltransferase [Flavobacterium sp.]|nr:geranylgeranylglycerol-phosphate geranylgeranyltransferase [Flavobacterium sp.]